MTIPEFLNNVQTDLNVKIIDKLDKTFNSHDFLEKFAEIFESEYIDFLNYYKGKGAFRVVHSQIGKYLRKHENDLKIKGIGKTDSKNLFGNFDGIEKWGKI